MGNQVINLFVIDGTHNPKPTNLPVGQVLDGGTTKGLDRILVESLKKKYPDAEYVVVDGFDAMQPAAEKIIANRKFSSGAHETYIGMWPVYFWHVRING